jgi:hypothetical protein
MAAMRTRFLIAALAAAFGLALIPGAGASAARSTASTDWYWSEYGMAHALYLNGITWRSGVDRMRETYCYGLGHWLVKTDGTRLFSHFYCTATPTTGSEYDIIANVTGPTLYAVSFVSYVKPQTWFWTAQYTANAIYQNGVRWLGTLDPVTYDACSPFGKWNPSDHIYFQHFYCSVHTNVRPPYTIVVNVTDKLSYTVKWVDFDTQLPATPAQPRPSVSATATSSASSSSGSTPDCDMYCNLLRLAEMPSHPSSGSDWLSQALINSALTDAQKRANRQQWGNDEAPSGASAWTGGVGCRNDAYPQTTPYTSITECG